MIAFFIGIVVLLVLAISGVPLGLALMSVGTVGFAMLHPSGFGAAFSLAGQQITETATSYQFAALPLFIAMGVLAARAGLSDDLFEAARRWIGHRRGGMAMATVVACGGFAAVSGSSAATAATMAKSALPTMKRLGYSDSLSTGSIAAGGTLGILIPPSGMMIIYGLLTEQDIASLFAAGLLPGILTIALFLIAIVVVTRLSPDAGPAGEKFSIAERFRALARVWGVLALFALIMSGLLFGVFSTNEAGGIGAAGALILALLRRSLTFRSFSSMMIEAAQITAKIYMLLFGSIIFAQFVNFSGMPYETIDFIRGIDASPAIVIAVILLIYLVLGMFIEGAAMIFLTVPIFVPIIEAMSFDLIWWGIVVVIAVELSLITPPIGMNVFILKALAPEVPVIQIFRGVMPFLLANIIVLGLVVSFPSIALWLPQVLLR